MKKATLTSSLPRTMKDFIEAKLPDWRFSMPGESIRGGDRNLAGDTKPFEILVAEDCPQDTELVRQALEEHQVPCAQEVVHDGAQAIAFIDRLDANSKAPRLDLLLLDMHLPRHDGEEVLRHMRSTTQYSQTPVIIMAGSPSCFMKEKAARHPAVVHFRNLPRWTNSCSWDQSSGAFFPKKSGTPRPTETMEVWRDA